MAKRKLWLKTRRGALFLILAAITSFSPPSSVNAQDCDSVLKQGIFDQSRYNSDDSYHSMVDDFIYASDFQTHDEAINAGLSVGFPVYGVPIEVGGTFSNGQRDAWKREKSNAFRSTLDKSSAVAAFRSKANPDILKAWLACIETISNQQGLKAGIQPIGKDYVYFWVRSSSADNRSPKVQVFQLVGLEDNGIIKKNTEIPSSGGGIGAFYKVLPSFDTVAVAIQTDHRGVINASLNYRAHQSDVIAMQTSQALQTAGFVVGEIRAFGFGPLTSELKKQGWIECDGHSLANADYPELFRAIGNNWGTDTPGIAFKVPDLRGYFLRGWDHGAGRDPEVDSRDNVSNGSAKDNVGSRQADEVGRHHHGLNGHYSDYPHGDDGNGGHVGMDGGDTHHAQPTDDYAGKETRPKNVYVMYAIYSGRPSN